MNKYKIIVIAWIYLCCLTILSSEESIVLSKSPSTSEEWQSSVSDYNNKVDAILDGEPEDLMITLKEIIEAKQSGDTETVKKLDSK